MVRLKTRWLLVRVDFWSGSRGFPGKKELAKVLREHLVQCFGVAAAGAALDTQVRFSDPTTRLVMVRTPREYCGLVRATITLLTSLNSNNSNSNQRVVLHVLSVNGSARTAKVVAIREVRRFYRERLLLQVNNKKTSAGDPTAMTSLKDKDTAKLCRSMEDGLQQISSIDF